MDRVVHTHPPEIKEQELKITKEIKDQSITTHPIHITASYTLVIQHGSVVASLGAYRYLSIIVIP